MHVRVKTIIVALSALGLAAVIYYNSDMGMQVQWAGYYPNISDLYESSDIIIRGIVRESHRRVSDDIETVHQVEILDLIKGQYNENAIPVTQMGGSYFIGKVVEPDDFPLFDRGDEVVLFLKQWGNGVYRSLGGPQGSYMVIEGKVYSVGEKLERVHSPGLSVNGTEVNVFCDMIS